jgi:hypothetical protein
MFTSGNRFTQGRSARILSGLCLQGYREFECRSRTRPRIRRDASAMGTYYGRQIDNPIPMPSGRGERAEKPLADLRCEPRPIVMNSNVYRAFVDTGLSAFPVSGCCACDMARTAFSTRFRMTCCSCTLSPQTNGRSAAKADCRLPYSPPFPFAPGILANSKCRRISNAAISKSPFSS